MNKTLIPIFIFSTLLFLFACGSKTQKAISTPLNGDVKEAVKLIQNYEGDVKEFELGLKENLVSDSFSMAIITDAMLKKGWTFNGSKKMKGGKIYFYKKLRLNKKDVRLSSSILFY